MKLVAFGPFGYLLNGKGARLAVVVLSSIGDMRDLCGSCFREDTVFSIDGSIRTSYNVTESCWCLSALPIYHLGYETCICNLYGLTTRAGRWNDSSVLLAPWSQTPQRMTFQVQCPPPVYGLRNDLAIVRLPGYYMIIIHEGLRHWSV